ncbi:MAG: SulP family inorganic anion transporter [Acidimicrobiales bacterium]|nr:SulP family inorganic anion transporter [Acidimicrobiaceae bacterium]MXZ15496.1 SulP family inorganic anion transporter [Acidimicrobiales bacterium]MYG62733.1 SulP family inorganic anion transporter [Acidimicrobiales bacterium]
MNYDSGRLRADLGAGLVSAIVVLPLALAFGVVSGLGPIAGLWGAVAVGFIAAVLGGSRVQVSAATAPMAIAVSFVLVRYADTPVEALVIIFIAGVLQVLMGLLRLGSLVQYTPYSVTSGFISGIGVMLVLLQVLPFFGADPILGNPIDSIRHWDDAASDMDFHAFGLAVTTFVICAGWPRQLRRYVPRVPGALVVGAIVGAVVFDGAPRIADVVEAPSFWAMEMPAGGFWGAVGAAVTIALIGAMNSLMNASHADSMTGQQHDPNREMIGVGLGNAVAAMFGGLPGAGSPSATLANVRAGAQTRVAGAASAVIALVLIIVLSGLIDAIPYAVLAGILLWLGLSLIDWRLITHLYRVQPEHVLVMLLTLGLTVFVDLLVAIAAGVVAAALAASRRFERLELDSVLSVPMLDAVFFADSDRVDISQFDAFTARVGMVKMRGSFTIASSNRLRIAISKDIVEHEVVILDFTETSYVDDSAALVVEQLIDAAMEHDTECIVIGLENLPSGSLQSLDVLHRVPGDHFVGSFDEARTIAARLLEINMESRTEA